MAMLADRKASTLGIANPARMARAVGAVKRAQ